MTPPITATNASSNNNMRKPTYPQEEKNKASPQVPYSFKDLLEDLRLEHTEGHYNR